MSNPDVLSSGSRRALAEHVRQHPGSHLREVARALRLPLGTALYHLDCLERAGVLVARRDGRYKRFFVADALGRAEKDYVSALHRRVPRSIVAALLEGHARTQRELSAAVGVSRSTLSFHVNALRGKGIVRCDEGWPEHSYAVADAAIAAQVLNAYFARPEASRAPAAATVGA